jgi:hypothetical protein
LIVEEMRSMQTQQQMPLPAWVAPVLVAGVAVVTFVAFWIGGQPGLGGVWAAVTLGLGLVIVLGGRGDAVRILGGVDDDERTRVLEYRATSAMGLVLVAALVGLFLASGIRGESGLVYGVLLLGAEVTHLTALAVLSRRS